MAKKKQLALPWRITGYVFKGIGLGIWYTLKGAGRLVGWGAP